MLFIYLHFIVIVYLLLLIFNDYSGYNKLNLKLRTFVIILSLAASISLLYNLENLYGWASHKSIPTTATVKWGEVAEDMVSVNLLIEDEDQKLRLHNVPFDGQNTEGLAALLDMLQAGVPVEIGKAGDQDVKAGENFLWIDNEVFYIFPYDQNRIGHKDD